MKKFIISIDQGTSSTRVILFDEKINIISKYQCEIKQYFPKSGWVEHDPNEIWSTTLRGLKNVIKKVNLLKGKIISIGITNQRETTIMWDKRTGRPIYKAIVWQDRRTQNYCDRLKKNRFEKIIKNKTGLYIDPYFSATKIKWILDNVESSKKLLKSDNLLFGTVDTFLIWKLTSGKKHLTDATNASRTMLYNIDSNKWDNKIIKKLGIPKKILPKVMNSVDDFGLTNKEILNHEIPISAVLGDQQAAAIGQNCFERGSIKSTFGTGAFTIINTGQKKIKSKNKLITTICYKIGNKTIYALEGSIFIAGAGVQWLRDKIRVINNAQETEKILNSTLSNKGVFIVPAFSGIGAPHWKPDAKGLITGLTGDSDWQTLVRATIESVAYQTFDLLNSFKKDGIKPKSLKIDGGMSVNNWFSQFLSDLLDLEVIRPKIVETTAVGVAFFAGYKSGLFKSFNDIKKLWKKDKEFRPKIKKYNRNKLIKGWNIAIKKMLID